MSNPAKLPRWQRERASLLHCEFEAIHASIKGEKAPLVKSLQQLSARIDGRLLDGGERVLKASVKNLTTLWYQWLPTRKAEALVPKYKSPKHVNQMPPALIRECMRLATGQYGGKDKNGKGVDASWVRSKLEERWHAGEALPGLGKWQEWWRSTYPSLDLPGVPPEFPWSEKTVCRRMGSKVVQKAGNVGMAAAGRALPRMRRDYSKLRKCEMYQLDDVRLDLVAIDDLTGRVVDVICYILIEVASRSIVAFVLKPKDALRAEDVDELLACGLQAEGYGIGIGYVTHIWFERGTIACSEAAKAGLEAFSEGGIKVHRTGMNKGVRWVGAAPDKSTGHSAGKAVIEAFNGKLHALLRHLPGQRGNSRENQPLNLGVGDSEVKDPSKSAKNSTRAEAERLQQFKLTAMVKGVNAEIELPLLLVSALHQQVVNAIKDYHQDRDHNMQGFHQIVEAEVAPGVWQTVSNVA